MPTPEEMKKLIAKNKAASDQKQPETLPENEPSVKSDRKFLVHSTFGEILDLALFLKEQGNETVVYIPDRKYKRIGNGMVEKVNDWYRELGKGHIWVFDGCEHGDLQDWLREQGETVMGGTAEGDELENERQINQQLFKKAGFKQPFSKNFKDIDEALAFVEENSDKRWILKQNGDAPKSINHMGKFEGSEDMIFHLKEMKKGWNEQHFGKFDCDLMEVVQGLEIAASGFFNGHDYLRNAEGKVVGFLNFEEKKEVDGNLGETTGETGTTFFGTTEDNDLFRDILLKPLITEHLAKMNFRGVFDVNCIVTTDGIVALEPTCRFGVPSTSYELLEALKTPLGEVLGALAEGVDLPIEITYGWGQVLVIAAKPYPLDSEAELKDESTSLGERLWIMDGDGETIIDDFTKDQRKHIHPFNFERTEDPETGENCYKVVTKDGYLLTATSSDTTGDDDLSDIENVRKNLRRYVKDNLYISGIKYRMDIGHRILKYESAITNNEPLEL